jgi:hypothetical protein
VKPLLEGDLEYGARIYAEAAEHHGAGELWKVWREIQKLREKDCEEAVQDLSSQGRRWFAKWAFANHQSDEGEIAYRAYLNEPGNVGPFDHENGVFLDHLLKKERWQEVIETVDQMKADYEDVPWEESRAIRAELALGKTANAVKRLQTVLDRHHDCGDYWAFSATIHARLANKKQAEVAFQESARLGVIEENLLDEMLTVLKINPNKWRTLRAPYDLGRAFPEQAKEWARNPGARLAHCSAPSPHWFGGDDFQMPACRGCGHPIRQWFRLDLRAIESLKEKLPAWRCFPLLGCVDCMVWMGRHDYQVDQQTMTVRLVNVATSTKRYGEALSNLPAISKQFVQLNWIPPNENPTEEELETPWERPQVGGVPLWTQDLLNVFCKSCRQEMVFVAAMASTPGFEPYIPINNESGYQYHFACNNCRTISVIAQWT